MPTPKFRILCTEDDGDTRDLIVIILNTHNCEVVTSASSAESVRLAQTQECGAQGYLTKPADGDQLAR